MSSGIHNLRNAFKRISLINISIRTKLLLIYLLCVLIPTIVFSYAFYSSTVKSAKNEKLIIYRQALDRIALSVESNAVSAIEISNIIYPNDAMYNFINNEYTNFRECLDDYFRYLDSAWDNMLPYNTNIVLFTVFTDNDTLVNGEHLQRMDHTVRQSDWYERYLRMDARNAFICHVDSFTTGTGKVKMVSYFRKLDYHAHSKYNHFLKITLRQDTFDKILRTESLPGEIYIIDENDIIIAQTYKRDKIYSRSEFISFDTVKPDPGEIVLTKTLKTPDNWRITCVLDKDFLHEIYKINWLQMIVLVFSVTVFAGVIIYIISASLYKRVDVLVEYMGRVSKEDYVLIPEDKKGNDEIGMLITSMNSMISKIGTLIEDVYKAKIRETQLELLKNQSELKALQCQVNPHFMFNVLETIRIKAYLRNELETARIVKYMSKIFRKLLLWDNDLIELKEELDFIKEYLEIQQYRYEEELDFEISAAEELLSFRIPKMTLQTFVDNACEHGFSESQNLKKIRVSAGFYDESTVELKVYDNGKGMTQEQIRYINDIECKGIGIKNVIGRMNLYFGENFRCEINSKAGEYTEIVLLINFIGLEGRTDV
jgi:two-component system sensor histidine kinase YesM